MAITIEQYERMIDEGVFHEDEHIELIRGEIVETAPFSFEHGMSLSNLLPQVYELVGNEVLVWIGSSIRIEGNSRPEPDLTLLKRRNYSKAKPPMSWDVILLIEIADLSLIYDRTVKGPLYAEANIPEYWIVNLKDNVVEVYTNPVEGVYKYVRKVQQSETLPLPGGLTGSVAASAILNQ